MSDLPATMRAAVLHGQLDLTIEERPVPEIGPRDVLLEVSHCGICGTDLHFVLEGWGQPPDDRGSRVQRACRRGRRRRRAMEARRRGRRRSVAAVRNVRVLPGGAAVAVHRQRAVRRRRAQRLRRRVRRVRARPRRAASSPLPPRCLPARRRARRAARGRAARPHAVACAPANASWSPAPARSARCRSPRLVPAASPTSS